MTTTSLSSPRTGALSRSLALAIEHTLAQQRPDGAWVSDPDPRIFETALGALALDLSPDPRSRAAAERARAWLREAAPQEHHPAARAIEEPLRAIALGVAGPLDLDPPALRDPAMASRVRLLHAIALARAPHATGYDPAELRAVLATAAANSDRIKAWSRVEVWSALALAEQSFGASARARWAIEKAAERQSPGGGFHGNPVTTAFAALALNAVDPRLEAARRATRWLLRHQFPDGTWRFCSSDVWDTTLMVRALRDEPVFAAQALPGAIAFLVRSQNADGGWPFRSGVESDNDTTGAALLALRGTGTASVAEAVQTGLRHLADQQLPDGLWRTWQSAGDPPTQDVNAHVVAAIDAHCGRYPIDPEPARDWLRACFEQDGQWTSSWYHGQPYAVSEVAPTVGGDDVVRRAVAALRETQNPDGGWSAAAGPGSVSSPAATGLALAALETGGLHDDACWSRATDYLIDTQRPDGTWPGVPLMYGPRPLLTHYQTHTQAFAALGLCAGLRVLKI